jgi:serine/threonine-protein kinase
VADLLPPGLLIDNKYRLEQPLGEGRAAVVYSAEHVFLEQSVALKLLARELSSRPGMAERFHRDARAVSRLTHPNLLRVTDFGRGKNGETYWITAITRGQPLARVLGGAGRVERAQAVALISQVLAALASAHAQGVLHGNLTPKNIFVEADGSGTRALLADLAIARLWPPGTLLHPYLSPEQQGGAPGDARSDVYSVGAVLAHLLSGAVPQPGTPPPANDPDLTEVLTRALAIDPAARYASAQEFATAFAALPS